MATYLFPSLAHSGVSRNGKGVCSVIAKSGDVTVSCCTSGYCLDKYPSQDIAQINSQINEQANAGLQRIKAQLSYMSLDNFIFHLSLFLAIKNVDITKNLCKFYFFSL